MRVLLVCGLLFAGAMAITCPNPDEPRCAAPQCPNDKDPRCLPPVCPSPEGVNDPRCEPIKCPNLDWLKDPRCAKPNCPNPEFLKDPRCWGIEKCPDEDYPSNPKCAEPRCPNEDWPKDPYCAVPKCPNEDWPTDPKCAALVCPDKEYPNNPKCAAPKCPNEDYPKDPRCADPPTSTSTTTTTTTTTTTSPTTTTTGPAPASSLVILYSFFNKAVSTHAYCSTPECETTVRAAGFTAEKSARGKIIAPTAAALAAAKKACDVEYLELRFFKKARGYMHDLNGKGSLVGYVPLTAACGATLPMKAYSPVVGDDIWYTYGNSKLIVRHNNRVLFYVWPWNE